jgi:heme oxygenase
MDARRAGRLRLIDAARDATPPHAALRLATAEAHERLHHLPPFDALAAGRLDRTAYRDLLGRLLGFHEPTEAAIAAHLGDAAFGLNLGALRRTALLRDDLHNLGMSDAAIGALPRAPAPALATAPAALGALYVTEGATLGGRLLARGLDPVLGPGETSGRHFLLAGTDATRPTWRDVRAAIDRCGLRSGSLAGMIDGASATFAAFGDWFAASYVSNQTKPDYRTRDVQ